MGENNTPTNIANELDTMKTVGEALDKLSQESRVRVIRWATEWFKLENDITPTIQKTPLGNNQIEEEEKQNNCGSIESFSDLPDFYSHINPKKTWEKALVVSYWIQKKHNDQDFVSRLISKELNNLGDGITNITNAMSGLINRKFIIQTRKSGSSKQAQKLYKVTIRGKTYIEDLMK